jgi:hypothetical protein
VPLVGPHNLRHRLNLMNKEQEQDVKSIQVIFDLQLGRISRHIDPPTRNRPTHAPVIHANQSVSGARLNREPP